MRFTLLSLKLKMSRKTSELKCKKKNTLNKCFAVLFFFVVVDVVVVVVVFS